VPTAGAPVAMASECGGATTRDGYQHLQVLSVDPLAAALDKVLPGITNDVGHLQRRPTQALRTGSPCVVSLSMSSGLEIALRCFWERCR
jgi:hypothetical protein